MAACCPPRLAVYTSEASFLLQPPVVRGENWGCLAVDRATGACSRRGAWPCAAQPRSWRAADAAASGALSDAERRALPAPVSACALLGILPLPGAAALCLATSRERTATLAGGAPLWRVTATRVLLAPPASAPPAEGAVERGRYAFLLRMALAEPGLYYSDAADATRAEQDALPALPGRSLAVRP